VEEGGREDQVRGQAGGERTAAQTQLRNPCDVPSSHSPPVFGLLWRHEDEEKIMIGRAMAS
jgi:hypothetical protein